MEENNKNIHHRKINLSRNKIKKNSNVRTKSTNSIKSINSNNSQINISKYKLFNYNSYSEISNSINRPTTSEIIKKILLPKIDSKNNRTPFNNRTNIINIINKTPNLEKRKINRSLNLYNYQGNKNINKNYIEITKSKNNLRIKNFNQVKNKLLNNNHEYKTNNNLNLKGNNKNHDFEKKTVLIQKMLRGSITRKKYEKKLSNIKNKNNTLTKSTQNKSKDKLKNKSKTKSKSQSKKKNKSKNSIKNKNKNKVNGLNKSNSKTHKNINTLTISSEVSKVSINSEDLNFSDEESDDINEDDLPSDID